MIPRVLDHVTHLWLPGVDQSSHGCVWFVEVWDWGGVPSGNVSVVLLNFFVHVSSACVCGPLWVVSWSCNIFTLSMRYFATLVAASLCFSMGTRLCCGYSLYWLETQIPYVVGAWSFRHL